MVGLLLPLIPRSSLMHLYTGLKHMGKDVQLIYISGTDVVAPS